LLIVAALIGGQPAAAQDLPSDFWPARNLAILHDFGRFWSVNTTFKPYRWEQLWTAGHQNGLSRGTGLGWILGDLLDETGIQPLAGSWSSDTLQARVWAGTLLQQPLGTGTPFQEFAGSPFADLTLWFGRRWSTQLYLRATSEPQSLRHFTGRPREVRRFGLNSAEFDHAVLSYRHDWLTVQYGRGRQNWGPFESENLVLSSASAAYDHFMAEARYKRFKFRFFYGFLEAVQDGGNINRYLVGHGIEYSNRRNLVVGLSEIVIFSGLNRPPDLSYLNPLVPHIEVELNDRTNKQSGTTSANAVWSLALDWLAAPGLRFSCNFVIDEIQLDNADRQQGRPDAIAYQVRAATSRSLGAIAATVSAEYVKVGTFTFRHEAGTNNLVSRNLPLGTSIGSDSDRWRLGLRLIFPQRVIASAAIGIQRQGERTILNNPYAEFTAEEFKQGPFPSGKVRKTRFLDWTLSYSPRRNLELAATACLSRQVGEVDKEESYVILSVNGYLPFQFNP
jgi:hypothetical protein